MLYMRRGARIEIWDDWRMLVRPLERRDSPETTKRQSRPRGGPGLCYDTSWCACEGFLQLA